MPTEFNYNHCVTNMLFNIAVHFVHHFNGCYKKVPYIITMITLVGTIALEFYFLATMLAVVGMSYHRSVSQSFGALRTLL